MARAMHSVGREIAQSERSAGIPSSLVSTHRLTGNESKSAQRPPSTTHQLRGSAVDR